MPWYEHFHKDLVLGMFSTIPFSSLYRLLKVAWIGETVTSLHPGTDKQGR